MSHFKIQNLASRTQLSARQNGFSLIEFMVASLIGIIILLAAGSTFMLTRNLNQQASERLAAQQDLRHASNLIIRDARQAGSFGCANLAADNVIAINGHNITNQNSSYLYLREVWHETDDSNRYGLNVVDADSFITNINFNTSFSAQGEALIFMYGDGVASIKNNPVNPDAVTTLDLVTNKNDLVGQVLTLSDSNITAPLVLASCSRIKTLVRGHDYTLVDNDTINLNPSVVISHSAVNGFRSGQLSVSKLAASAYVVGKMSGSNMTGLYRFTLQANGNWSEPQLLVSDLDSNNGMSMQFGYVKAAACPNGTANSNEQYQFSNNLQNVTEYSKLPALVRIHLNVIDGANRSNSNADIGTIQEYVIDAAVRGGNICANRSL